MTDAAFAAAVMGGIFAAWAATYALVAVVDFFVSVAGR